MWKYRFIFELKHRVLAQIRIERNSVEEAYAYFLEKYGSYEEDLLYITRLSYHKEETVRFKRSTITKGKVIA